MTNTLISFTVEDMDNPDLSPEAAALFKALLDVVGHGAADESASDWTLWSDVDLRKVDGRVPFKGAQLAGLYSALEAKRLYRPLDSEWGMVRRLDEEDDQAMIGGEGAAF